MRGNNGLAWLIILSSCFMISCLGYVHLLRDLAPRVSDPGSTEYWQIRTIALQFRNPEQEARQAASSGNFQAWQIDSSIAEACQVSGSVSDSVQPSAVLAGFSGSSIDLWSTSRVSAHTAARDYRAACDSFADRYNRELVRAAGLPASAESERSVAQSAH